MLDAKPKEPEWLSWTYVGLASICIFLTVPFARAIQKLVETSAGENFFLYITVAAALCTGYLTITNIKKRKLPRTAYLWLACVGTAFTAYAYYLRDIPEEAFHLVEYGLLGLLVYRALVHRMGDSSIYIAATLIVGMIGLMDEWIQWMTPSRIWSLGDVRINLIAGGLTQVAIFGAFRPSIVSGHPSRKNLRSLFLLAALGMFGLFLSYMNTPDSIRSYAKRFTFLAFLLDSKSMMVEYGYLYEDPDIGIFRSRFTLKELRKNDRRRGLYVAKVLDEFINENNYDRFQEIYSVPRNAYVHEAGVHLFRRNRVLQRAFTHEHRRDIHYNYALRENRILERYFPTALANSKHVLSPETLEYIERKGFKDDVYESRVSKDLITRFSKEQAFYGFVLAISALLMAAGYFRERDDSSPGN